MQDAIVVNGRVTGPHSVELDEPLSELRGEVEVILRRREAGGSGANGAAQSIFDYLRQLSAGARDRAEIDQQLNTERNAWDDP